MGGGLAGLGFASWFRQAPRTQTTTQSPPSQYSQKRDELIHQYQGLENALESRRNLRTRIRGVVASLLAPNRRNVKCSEVDEARRTFDMGTQAHDYLCTLRNECMLSNGVCMSNGQSWRHFRAHAYQEKPRRWTTPELLKKEEHKTQFKNARSKILEHQIVSLYGHCEPSELPMEIERDLCTLVTSRSLENFDISFMSDAWKDAYEFYLRENLNSFTDFWVHYGLDVYEGDNPRDVYDMRGNDWVERDPQPAMEYFIKITRSRPSSSQ